MVGTDARSQLEIAREVAQAAELPPEPPLLHATAREEETVAGAEAPPARPRNLVLCLDGTSNEPERRWTNVVRLYSVLDHGEDQLLYYDPGVGTMGARGAVTRFGKAWTRLFGLAFGHGIKDNIEEAYTWLMETYQPGDRIFLFGFSRGAFTARAVAGMLATVGLLRPSATNLVPYALKLFTRARAADRHEDGRSTDFWDSVDSFNATFCRAEFPSRWNTRERQVHFVGLWDTVRTVGWFGGFLFLQFRQAQWPFVQSLRNVETARHAMALDERRAPYPVYRISIKPLRGETPQSVRDRLQEVWFAGNHGDVGGQDPHDHRLSDLALDWMVREAVAAGLRVRPKAYAALQGLVEGRARQKVCAWSDVPQLPADRAMGEIHRAGGIWRFLSWSRRVVQPGDRVHEAVLRRRDETAGGPRPYRPRLPADIMVVETLTDPAD